MITTDLPAGPLRSGPARLSRAFSPNFPDTNIRLAAEELSRVFFVEISAMCKESRPSSGVTATAATATTTRRRRRSSEDDPARLRHRDRG